MFQESFWVLSISPVAKNTGQIHIASIRHHFPTTSQPFWSQEQWRLRRGQCWTWDHMESSLLCRAAEVPSCFYNQTQWDVQSWSEWAKAAFFFLGFCADVHFHHWTAHFFICNQQTSKLEGSQHAVPFGQMPNAWIFTKPFRCNLV